MRTKEAPGPLTPGPGRSRERVEYLQALIDEVTAHERPITLRHLFYLMTAPTASRSYVIDKTEAEYTKLCEAMTTLRREGRVPWTTIVDGTRMKREWRTYGSLAEAAEDWRDTYTRDLWRQLGLRVEVWSESRGLLSYVDGIAARLQVTTLGLGGFGSVTVLYETAELVSQSGDLHVFHLGDHDPSGDAAASALERGVRSFLDDDEQERFHFTRLALTAEQVDQYQLPSRPAKGKEDVAGKRGNRHNRGWDGGATELDAMDPDVLVGIVEQAVLGILPAGAWERHLAVQEAESETLTQFLAGLPTR